MRIRHDFNAFVPEHALQYVADILIFSMREPRVAFGLRHMTGIKKDGERIDLWFRATACVRRTTGGWKIAHVHNSVPFAMDGSGRALLDLRP